MIDGTNDATQRLSGPPSIDLAHIANAQINVPLGFFL